MAEETPKKVHAELKKHGREFTYYLRKHATDIARIEPDGTPVSYQEAMAIDLLKRSCDRYEEVEDPKTGKIERRVCPLTLTALNQALERLEGKATTAQQENTGGIKALDKVRQLNVDRANDLSKRVRNKLPDPTPPRRDDEE